jgi:hypothetical protein
VRGAHAGSARSSFCGLQRLRGENAEGMSLQSTYSARNNTGTRKEGRRGRQKQDGDSRPCWVHCAVGRRGRGVMALGMSPRTESKRWMHTYLPCYAQLLQTICTPWPAEGQAATQDAPTPAKPSKHESNSRTHLGPTPAPAQRLAAAGAARSWRPGGAAAPLPHPPAPPPPRGRPGHAAGPGW